MDDEIELDEECCPKCGTQMYWRRCDNCDDGWITDLYDEDPMWYDEDEIEICHECNGHGRHRWCLKCGFDALSVAAQHGVQPDVAVSQQSGVNADDDHSVESPRG